MSGQDGFGTLFQRGNDAGNVFVTMGGVTNISGPARSRETIDVTAHDSPDGWMEFIGGLKDGGEVSCDINYDPSDDTHDLDDDFDDVTPRKYRIVLLPGTEDEHTWTINGVLTGLEDEFPYDDKMTRSLTIKVTGKPTLVQTGS
ncbi:MAG: phage tail tube protein [Patulibacter sp.]|nr:phage tail tube protein [Patulibacter sp.]